MTQSSRVRDVRDIKLDAGEAVVPNDKIRYAIAPTDEELLRYANATDTLPKIRQRCVNRIYLGTFGCTFNKVIRGQQFVDLGPVWDTSWNISIFETITSITTTACDIGKPWENHYLTVNVTAVGNPSYHHSRKFADAAECEKFRLAFTDFCNEMVYLTQVNTPTEVGMDFAALEARIMASAIAADQPGTQNLRNLTGRFTSTDPAVGRSWGIDAGDSNG